MLQHVGRLARTTTVYGLGQVLLRFISLLLMPLFTSYLTPKEYGISAVLGLISMVASPVFSLGLGTAIGVCYFESESVRHRSTVIWSSIVVLVASVVVLLCAMLPFASIISEKAFQTTDYALFIQLNALSLCIGILLNPFLYYLQFEERAVSYSTITLMVGIVSIGLSIYFVVNRKMGLEGVLIATVIAQTFSLIAFAAWSLRTLAWGWSREISQRLLRLGIPLIPSFFFLFVIMQGNKYLLQNTRSLDELGVYNIGVNMGTVMNILVGAFTTAWTPFFLSFAGKQEDGRILFGRLTTYYVMGFGLISLAFYMAARPLVLLLTASAYHGAFVSVGPTATAYFLTGVFSMLLPSMYFAQEVNYLGVVQTIAVVVTVAFGFAAIPPMGVLGAALTPVVGMFAMVIAQAAWNFRRGDRYLQIDYPIKRLVAFGVFYCVIATILLADRNLPLVGEIAISSVAGVVSIVAVALLIPVEDRLAGWAAVQGFLNWISERRLKRRIAAQHQ